MIYNCVVTLKKWSLGQKSLLKMINVNNTPHVYNIQIAISHQRTNIIRVQLCEVLRKTKF